MKPGLREFLVGALTIAALTGPGRAPAQPAAAAEADRRPQIDALFAAYDRSDSPGCALGVFRDGRMAYARGYGMANLELGVALSPQSVFDIGSLAKQVTAFSIFLLARDGKLSIDDDIRKFVPEIPSYGAPVTLRNLLHHTGGLRDYIGLLYLGGARYEDVTTERDALDALARQKGPSFAPGARYEYSNTGYFLLGLVVKRASGRSLREFAGERIFGPLGMTHTQYNDDHTRVIPNRATSYEPEDGGGFGISASDFEQNGDGGVFTTVEDLLRWDANFYEPVVGDRALLDQMQTPGKLADGTPIDYASGLRIGAYRGLRTVGHTGSWAGYRAILYRFPDQKFSVAILCNRPVDRQPIMRRVADLYLGNAMEKPAPAAPPPVSLSAAQLERFAGAYRNPLTGEVSFVAVRGSGLIADIEGDRLRLQAASPDRFVPESGPGPEIHFGASQSGGRPRLEATWTDEETSVFEPIAAWSPTETQLASFAGAYTSDEIPTVFRFEVVAGKLILRHRTISDDPWKPTLPDSFALWSYGVTFTRNAAGTVDGFRGTGELMGVRFRKIGS